MANITTGDDDAVVKLNYQMWAFCPMISRQTCGVDTSSSTDMRVYANMEEQMVYSKDMRYVEGMPDDRRYDACYYEVTTGDNSTINNLTDSNVD